MLHLVSSTPTLLRSLLGLQRAPPPASAVGAGVGGSNESRPQASPTRTVRFPDDPVTAKKTVNRWLRPGDIFDPAREGDGHSPTEPHSAARDASPEDDSDDGEPASSSPPSGLPPVPSQSLEPVREEGNGSRERAATAMRTARRPDGAVSPTQQASVVDSAAAADAGRQLRKRRRNNDLNDALDEVAAGITAPDAAPVTVAPTVRGRRGGPMVEPQQQPAQAVAKPRMRLRSKPSMEDEVTAPSTAAAVVPGRRRRGAAAAAGETPAAAPLVNAAASRKRRVGKSDDATSADTAVAIPPETIRQDSSANEGESNFSMSALVSANQTHDEHASHIDNSSQHDVNGPIDVDSESMGDVETALAASTGDTDNGAGIGRHLLFDAMPSESSSTAPVVEVATAPAAADVAPTSTAAVALPSVLRPVSRWTTPVDIVRMLSGRARSHPHAEAPRRAQHAGQPLEDSAFSVTGAQVATAMATNASQSIAAAVTLPSESHTSNDATDPHPAAGGLPADAAVDNIHATIPVNDEQLNASNTATPLLPVAPAPQLFTAAAFTFTVGHGDSGTLREQSTTRRKSMVAPYLRRRSVGVVNTSVNHSSAVGQGTPLSTRNADPPATEVRRPRIAHLQHKFDEIPQGANAVAARILAQLTGMNVGGPAPSVQLPRFSADEPDDLIVDLDDAQFDGDVIAPPSF